MIEFVDAFDEAGRPAKGLASSGLPVIVDFLSSKMQHRIRQGVDSEIVVKVMGVKKSERKDPAKKLICDFTAGLGVDSFLLANAGFQMISFERDLGIFRLLEDGIGRYKSATQEQDQVDLQFQHLDTGLLNELDRQRLLQSLPQRPYAVLLDPMYEETSTKTKSLPKKEMAVLRQILKPSTVAELSLLLETALYVADSRVVVKRPMGRLPWKAIDGRPIGTKAKHRALIFILVVRV